MCRRHRLPLLALLIALLAPAAHAGPEKRPGRRDWYGNPLPAGAVARFGKPEPSREPCLVAVSADLRLVARAFDGQGIHLADLRTGQHLHTLARREPTYYYAALTFSSDGKVLASGDLTTILWDTATGKELRRLAAGKKDGTSARAFSPDGKLLATGHPTGVIRLWEVASGKELRKFPRVEHAIGSLAFSPDGKLLASADSGDRVRLWDVAAGKQRASSGRQEQLPGCLAFLPDGKALAVAQRLPHSGAGMPLLPPPGIETEQYALQWWSVPALRKVRRFATGGDAPVLAVARGGRVLATGGMSGAIRVWDARTGKVLHQFGHHVESGVVALSISADGTRLAAAGGDGAVSLWELAEGKLPLQIAGPDWPPVFIAFSADGRALTAVQEDGLTRVWDDATGKELRRFRPRPHVRILLTGGSISAVTGEDPTDHTIYLHHFPTGKRLATLRGHQGFVDRLAASADGKVLVSFSDADETIRAWDVTTGKQIGRARTPEYPLQAGGDRLPDFSRQPVDLWALQESLALSPDGHLFVAAFHGRIHRWTVPRVTELPPLVPDGPADRGCVLAFSPDGRTLVTGDSSGAVRCWEVSTGKLRCKINVGPRRGVFRLAVSPDGRLLAAATAPRPDKVKDFNPYDTDDYRIHLLDLVAQKQVWASPKLGQTVSCLAFSPDGRRLASDGDGPSVLLWDATGGLPRPRAAPVSRERLEALGAELFGRDAARAYRALGALVEVPDLAVPFLGKRVRPAPPLDRDRIPRLLKDLDDDRFAVREAAARALADLGPRAEPALRRALEGRPSLEMRRRLERLLADLDRRPPPAEYLRALRALEVLERIGTKEAREVLERLAKGAADAPLTEEAAAALRRLRTAPKP